jgi:hypothetical protein
VLGYLDDLVIVPLGIMLAVWLIPEPLMVEHRASAAQAEGRPVSKVAAVAIISVWVGAIALTAWLAWRYVSD